MKHVSVQKKDPKDVKKIQNLLMKDKDTEKEDLLLGEEEPEENLRRAGYKVTKSQISDGPETENAENFLDYERSLSLLEQIL